MDFSKRPLSDDVDTKAEFRKPSADASSRKYRRRSPLSRSSSSDESPKQDRISSPKLLRDNVAKDFERWPRKINDRSDLGKDLGRSQYGQSSDSYRHSDLYSSRSSHGYSRSSRESRGGAHSNHTREEGEHSRSRDSFRDVDKYSRDKYDGSGQRSRDMDSSSERGGFGRRHAHTKEMESDGNMRNRRARDDRRDYHRSSGDYKSDRTFEEPKGSRNDPASGRDDTRHHLKEPPKSDRSELHGLKISKEEGKKYNDRETKWDKDLPDNCVSGDENQEVPAKKTKLFSSDRQINCEYVSKFRNAAAEKQSSSSSSKQVQNVNITRGQGHGQSQAGNTEAASDISNAKVAAMKAAELVNKNLVGVGFMTADQKKKLLWGNKKSTASEEAYTVNTGNRWDTLLFEDRERQEKFNKLMSLRLPWWLWPIVGCKRGVEGGPESGQSRWWQQPPSGREAEGTPAGFREAIHCGTKKKRWPYSRIRSLRKLHVFCMYYDRD